MLPSFLSKGDRVAVVATAKVFDVHDVKSGIEVLRSWGLEVVEGKNLFQQDHYFAGNDTQRLSDLQDALDDTECKAILFARGGYGTSRIIDAISWKKFKKNPKWLIGFSDLTILHLHLATLSVAGIHGNMCLQLAKPAHQKSVQALRETLAGKIPSLNSEPHVLNRIGNTSGIVLGGNLTLLIHSLGTPSEPNLDGTILYLEEIGESLYHLDRMMLHLKRAGKLKKLKGLILGHFTDMSDTDPSFGKSVSEIIIEHVAGYKYPVAFGFSCGHEAPNMPLVLGAKYKLMVKAEGASLSYSSN